MSWAIGAIGLLLFTLGLHNQAFVGFESRFALFAKEMLRHGPSVFPTTYGEPYPDYPATATLLIYWLAIPFGDVGRLAAAIPTALASALNLALSYRLLAVLSRRWALLTVCFELLTFTFLAEARALSLDQMVTTVTLACFLLVYSVDREQRFEKLKWLPLLLLIGFALRGPLGLVIPAGVVCSYYALSAQWPRLLRTGLLAALVLAVAWAGLLALAALEGGRGFVAEVVRMQVSGRLESKTDLDRWYYFISGFSNYALAWPAAFAVLLLAARRFRERHRDPALAMVFFLAGWVLLVVVGLSIPHTKKARYLLPVVPALSAIATYPFIAHGDRALAALRRLLHGILVMLPGIALAALWFGAQMAQKKGFDLHLPLHSILIALFVCQLGSLVLQFRREALGYRELGAAGFAVLALWLGYIALLEPALRQIHDTRSFVSSVEQLRGRALAPLAFYTMGKDADAIKYLVNVDYDLAPAFYQRAADLSRAPARLYIVAPASRDRELSAAGAGAPIFSGRFDNKLYSVFYLNRSATATAPPAENTRQALNAP